MRLVIVFNILFLFSGLLGTSVTYEFSGGRFGDNLLSYLHAKWIELQYQTKLVYRPFPYSDQLQLHLYETAKQEKPTEKIILNNLEQLKSNRNCTFWIPFFGEAPYDTLYTFTYKIEWDNPSFLAEIRKTIAPINPLTLITPPKKSISLAVHVRRNESKLLIETTGPQPASISYNDAYGDYNDIVKFPPDFWYIDQIKIIAEIFKHYHLYVFIFTDKNPGELKRRFSERLCLYNNITFDCREAESIGRDNLVLEDFFSLLNFDCLIRPQSTFSLIAGKLADYLIEISPMKGHWKYINNRWIPIIDQIEISCGKNFCKKITNLRRRR